MSQEIRNSLFLLYFQRATPGNTELAERVTATNSVFFWVACASVRSQCVILDRHGQPSNRRALRLSS